MIDPRKQRFLPYLRQLANMIALKDWRIEIREEPPEHREADASIRLIYGRKFAIIAMSESFLNLSPEDQRKSLIHELIHCHVEQMWEFALERMPSDMESSFKRIAEYAVDGLADGFASHLPLLPAIDG